MLIQSNEQLIEFISNGGNPKYVFFWGHQKPKSGVSKSCFSQWYESKFEDDGLTFLTAEHFMMYQKAKLFNNPDIENKILSCNHPSEAKKLGRMVVGFDESIWNAERFNIVVKANLLKFSQSPEILEFLENTGDRILVESSPVDKIWGIGLASDDEKIEQPGCWKGLNLLGYALMAVREKLREEV